MNHISPDFNALLMKCLEKEYQNRFNNFEEIIGVLKGKGSISITKEDKKVEALTPSGSTIQRLVPVTINVEPPYASVLLDDEPISDKNLKIAAGFHSIKVTTPGFQTVESEIEVSDKLDNEFHIEMERIAGYKPLELVEMIFVEGGSFEMGASSGES